MPACSASAAVVADNSQWTTSSGILSQRARSADTAPRSRGGYSSPDPREQHELAAAEARGRDVVGLTLHSSRTTRPYTKRTLPCGSRGATEPMSPAPCSTSVTAAASSSSANTANEVDASP